MLDAPKASPSKDRGCGLGRREDNRACRQNGGKPGKGSCEISRHRSGHRRTEVHGETVHAITQAGRRRAIVKDMAQMASATVAMDLDALENERSVGGGINGIRQGLIEAWPARSAVELGFGNIEGQIAGGAGEDAFPPLVLERAAK